MRPTLQSVPARLRDERGGRVVFVSHCLLNQNVRYLGGALRPGVVDELLDRFARDGVGIVQLPCPEEHAWGGVLKRILLAAFGLRLLRGWLRRPLLALFTLYTRAVYRRLARVVARQVEDYVRSGFEVVGIVGVAGSPSCGVRTTLDLSRALDVVADVPLSALTRDVMNERVVAANVVAGEGWFVAALRRALARRGLGTPRWELDLAPVGTRPLPPRADSAPPG